MIEAFTHEFYRQSVSFSEGGAGEHLRREVERLGESPRVWWRL